MLILIYFNFFISDELSVDKYMLFAGWEVRIVKNCDLGLEKCCPRPQAEDSIFKTEVTVFHYTDRPKPVNNLFIFSSLSNDFVYSREKNSRKRYCDRGQR